MMSVIRDYLCHAANTVFHMYQYPFNASWDQKLLRALKAGEVLAVDKYTITFACDGDVLKIWTTSRWYAYAHLYQLNGEYVGSRLWARPRFRTMRLLHNLDSATRPPAVTRQDYYDLIKGAAK